jgi:hypothetical protein
MCSRIVTHLDKVLYGYTYIDGVCNMKKELASNDRWQIGKVRSKKC